MSKSRDIDIQVLIEKSAKEVYEAWLKPELLEKWLARKAHVERSVGGAYELFWDLEHPARSSTLGCRITNLVPNSEISFNWKTPAEAGGTPRGETHVFIRLEAAEGGTLLRFVHTGWGAGARWEKARLWQAEAWREAIENLKNMLESTDRFMQNISMN